MTTELITLPRIFRPKRTIDMHRQLEGLEITLIRYLGIHCGIGGQVRIPRHYQKAAASAVRLGLVHLWYRHEWGLGLTLPFYGLTDRGRQLAAALLCPRPKPRRTIIGANHGEGNVSSR